MRFSIILLFFLILSSFSVYAEECDFGIEIIPNKYVFEYNENANFTINVFKNNGPTSDIILEGKITDLFGNVIENYRISLNGVANERNPKREPRVPAGSPYIIYFNLSEINCNDTNSINNFNEKLIFVLPEPLGQDYTTLEITEFFPHPTKHDAPMPEGEWIELYNSGDEYLDIEKLIINDDYGNGINISDVNILQNTTIIEPHDYLVIYRNQDGRLELNNEGFDKVRLFYKNILLDEISYSHTKEGLSWSKVNDYWIQTIPTPNEENYFEEPDYSSHLEIDRAYLGSNDKAKFGDSLRVKIKIYKGDTEKYNLDLYLVDESNKQVSKRSEVNIEDKFINYTMIVPLQIEPNCNKKYPDGTYKIILKGLDEIDAEEIEIEGITESLCEEIKIKEETSLKTTPISFSTNAMESESESFTSPITSSVIYQSSDVKARNLGIYFFCAVLLLLIIYLIFKKSL